MIHYCDCDPDLKRKIEIDFLKDIITNNFCSAAWNCKKVYQFPYIDTNAHWKKDNIIIYNHYCPLREKYCESPSIVDILGITGGKVKRHPKFREIAADLLIQIEPDLKSFVFDQLL